MEIRWGIAVTDAPRSLSFEGGMGMRLYCSEHRVGGRAFDPQIANRYKDVKPGLVPVNAKRNRLWSHPLSLWNKNIHDLRRKVADGASGTETFRENALKTEASLRDGEQLCVRDI